MSMFGKLFSPRPSSSLQVDDMSTRATSSEDGNDLEAALAFMRAQLDSYSILVLRNQHPTMLKYPMLRKRKLVCKSCEECVREQDADA